ncbi:hypothetical protein GE061_015747 [Apolygus lucorum]|uniref:Uncharacterized protein n=1 Tax=Apolygus lucorum TaxID=248454 RepID=A0A8S9XLS1_APOLU|nr:hypothetical protein GE061_015747 [Apolygus lucorum]
MLVPQLIFLLACATWSHGYKRTVDSDDSPLEPVSAKADVIRGGDKKNQAEIMKSNVDFHHDIGEFYYESLQEPIVETDVLVPIQREELPIPLNDRSKKRELVVDDDNVKGSHYRDAGAGLNSPGDVRGTRDTAKCRVQKPVYPRSSCSRSRQMVPTELGGECVRDPPFDLSWMTCDAEIQDWAYRRNSPHSEQKTRWNGVVHVAPSPSFKEIVDGFWRDQAGAGFLAMYNEVKSSYENKLEKRQACGKRETETQVYSKWDSLKDKVLEVRRDIRLRMIRQAELGQLSKPGMIFLRDEELISEAVELDKF